MPDETYNELNIDGDIRPIEDATARAEIANKMDKDNPTGTGAFSMGRKAETTIGTQSHTEGSETTASGYYSHAEGGRTTASGRAAHAEGVNTTASGQDAHAEGNGTIASGYYSHAEGRETTASGFGAHAEGRETTASGDYSHAEGYETTARGMYQHVSGRGNVEDVQNEFIEIVGNGSADSPSNARTLDWEGNEEIAGDLTFNGSTSLTAALNGKQAALVSGSNIKTINGASVLGSGNISVPHPDNFTEIKTSGTAATQSTSGAWHDDYHWTFPAVGLWLVQVSLTWETNATGYRMSGVNTSVAQPQATNVMRTATNPYNQTTHNITLFFNVTSTSQNYYLVSYQNSGQDLTTYPRITAIRLKT